MDYITIATTGNATDFGDLSQANIYTSGLNSLTRGVFGLGDTSGGIVNITEYITIATTANSIDFGDMTITKAFCAGIQNGL